MALICPAILAGNETEFLRQLNHCAGWARRLQIDLIDGRLPPATSPTVRLDRIGWPPALRVDLHLMYGRPGDYLDQLVELQPNLVIIHPESSGDHQLLFDRLRAAGIRVGLALRAETRLLEAKRWLGQVDHGLVFAGNLGRQGGQADLAQLELVAWLRQQYPQVEVGWDGGANPGNIGRLVAAGVDVVYVGSYLSRAADSLAAMEELAAAAETDAGQPGTASRANGGLV